MGHISILVIGDNFRDQLQKYQFDSYADPSNRHFVTEDVLAKVKSEYASSTDRFLRDRDGRLHNPYDKKRFPVPAVFQVPDVFAEVRIPLSERMSFVEWAKMWHGLNLLAHRAEPEVHGEHKLGWIRIDANGDVMEAFRRTIPDGFFQWFVRTESQFQLKPGARGLNINGGEISLATEGFAGLARKSAIDFKAMREVIRAFAGERWDRAADDDAEDNGLDWDQMSTVERGAASMVWYGANNAPAIHPRSLTRHAFLERFERLGLGELFSFGEVIKDGVLLEKPDLNELIESLPEDAVLTCALVRC